MLVSDDAGCLFEAATPVNLFDVGVVRTCDRMSSVLFAVFYDPGLSICRTNRDARYCTPVEVQENPL